MATCHLFPKTKQQTNKTKYLTAKTHTHTHTTTTTTTTTTIIIQCNNCNNNGEGKVRQKTDNRHILLNYHKTNKYHLLLPHCCLHAGGHIWIVVKDRRYDVKQQLDSHTITWIEQRCHISCIHSIRCTCYMQV